MEEVHNVVSSIREDFNVLVVDAVIERFVYKFEMWEYSVSGREVQRRYSTYHFPGIYFANLTTVRYDKKATYLDPTVHAIQYFPDTTTIEYQPTGPPIPLNDFCIPYPHITLPEGQCPICQTDFATSSVRKLVIALSI